MTGYFEFLTRTTAGTQTAYRHGSNLDAHQIGRSRLGAHAVEFSKTAVPPSPEGLSKTQPDAGAIRLARETDSEL